MPEDAAVRRARYFLYLLGGVFVAMGFALENVPALAAVAHPFAGRISAALGAALLAMGRFGSDRFVRRFEMALTGWF
jgi:hypothetical protein